MKANQDDRGELELNAQQRMQALVCAYVLGEVDEAERAEVEAALAKSPELRAEEARFEATVGVVSNVLKERAGEVLSPHSTAQLDSAVVDLGLARRARPSFFSSPLVRIAAGVAVVLGGYAVYREASMPPPPGVDRDRLDVASVEKTKRDAQAGKDAKRAEKGATLDAHENGKQVRSIEASEEALVAAVEPTADAQAGEAEAAPNAASKLDPRSAPEPRDKRTITGATFEQLDGAVELRERAAKLGGVVTEETLSDLLKVGERSSTAMAGRPSTVSGQGGKNATSAGSGPSSPGLSAAAPMLTHGELEGLQALGYLDEGAVAGEPVRDAAGPESRTASGHVYSDEADGAFAGRTENFFLGKEEKGRSDGLDEEAAPAESVAGDDKFSADSRFEVRRFKDIRRQPTELELLRQRYQHIHDHCVLPIGSIRPRDMFFRYWGDNPFELTLLDKQSTFSVDVDTASYTLARRYLVEGQLPTKEQVRTEEFVNYFKGDVPPPTEGTFAIATELAPSLFGDDSNTWMLRVAVRGKEVAKSERQPLALTFVVDVSGSMREGARLELVKHSLRLLVSQLDASDSISLIKFSNDAALLLPMTSARHKDLIESAIHPLQPDGSTNTEAGLRMGYEQALAALTPNAQNRVVLLTDGVANVGIVDPNALVQMVERQRKAGIYLNTVGVGMNNVNDNLLEQLANKGDGVCNYVDDEQEVRRALVDNFTSAFQVIARDVKIQVEFDAAQVERYRLLGYENRAIADVDFRNDKVDAGEVGAGHQVVALYELVRRGATGDGPLATVRLRWKPPFQAGVPENEQGAATEVAHAVHARSAAASYGATSPGYRRAVLVAQFAEFLRRSVHARRDSLERLIDEGRKLAGELKDKEFDEFLDMAARSRDLIHAELRRRDWLDDCGYLLRHRHYLHGQIDELRRRFPSRFADPRYAAELEQELRLLDQRLGELGARVEAERGDADGEMIKRLEAENIELQRRLLALLDRARAPVDGK
jgi:Ca-activated chloride channel family protein